MNRRRMQSLEQLADDAEQVTDFDHDQDMVAYNLELEPPTRFGFPVELDRVIRPDWTVETGAIA